MDAFRLRTLYGLESHLRLRYWMVSSRRILLRRSLTPDCLDQWRPGRGLVRVQARRRLFRGRLPGRFPAEWIRFLSLVGWGRRWRRIPGWIYLHASTITFASLFVPSVLLLLPLRRSFQGSSQTSPALSRRLGRGMGIFFEDSSLFFPLDLLQERTWLSFSSFFPRVPRVGSGVRWGRTRWILSELLGRGVQLYIGRQKSVDVKSNSAIIPS